VAGRFISADTVIPSIGNTQAWDRYAYSYGNPVKYTDPTGYFSEDQIKQYLGFEKDDPWEEVLKLFQKGGKYEGRWGWLETLRKAEVGDQITIDWMDGIPGNGMTLPNTLTYDLDANGNLILTGDGTYFDAELAGLYGDNYKLTHYTDLSDLCSPFKCRYVTEFSTSAIHDPYLHTKIKWEEFSNLGTDGELIELFSYTVAAGSLTGILGATSIVVCTNPITYIAGVPPLAIAFFGAAWGTVGLGEKTYEYFMNEFTEITP
jgi:hypothetical protein